MTDTRKRLSTSELTDQEKERFAAILLERFPWLGTQEEDIGGADTICELDNLYLEGLDGNRLLELTPIDQVKDETEAREIAINWQHAQSQEAMSWGEAMELEQYFEALAKKFDLTDEFRENGIL